MDRLIRALFALPDASKGEGGGAAAPTEGRLVVTPATIDDDGEYFSRVVLASRRCRRGNPGQAIEHVRPGSLRCARHDGARRLSSRKIEGPR